eukprot:scaffold10116_cov127-Cylindrotheca_fusiformis.AAC.7
MSNSGSFEVHMAAARDQGHDNIALFFSCSLFGFPLAPDLSLVGKKKNWQQLPVSRVINVI